MKIATGIIGLLLGLVIILQSCVVVTGGSLGNNNSLTEEGSVGILVGFIYFIGGAFAFGMPTVSLVIFLVAALFALLVGVTGSFSDMTIWGIIAIVLAALSYFARRADRKLETGQNQRSL